MNLDEFLVRLERDVALVREGVRSANPCTLKELEQSLLPVVLRYAAELEAAAAHLPEAVTNAGFGRLTRVVDDERRAHRQWQEEKKPKSKFLGNILANATASVDDPFWTAFRWKPNFVAICKTCGAPQERERDFRCRYCRGHLFQSPNEESPR